MNDACFECGSENNIHQHHIIPQSRGGTATVPLCGSCHAKAHGVSTDWDLSTLTSEALKRKKARGEHTGGDVPYGKTVDDEGKLHPGVDATIGACIVEWRDNRGLSYRQIAERLEEHGFQPKGKRFYANTIRRIYERKTCTVKIRGAE